MKKPSQEVIEENLKRVGEGKELTCPLADLGEEFKNKYREKYGDSMHMLRCHTIKLHNNTCIICGEKFKTRFGNSKVCKVCRPEYYKSQKIFYGKRYREKHKNDNR